MAAGPELEEGEIGEVIMDVSAAAAPIEAPAVRRRPRYGMLESQQLTRLLQLGAPGAATVQPCCALRIHAVVLNTTLLPHAVLAVWEGGRQALQ